MGAHMGAHTQQDEASLTSIEAPGREVGKVKEKTTEGEEEGGWDWLVVVGRLCFQAIYVDLLCDNLTQYTCAQKTYQGF